jgi:hypothetical protein
MGVAVAVGVHSLHEDDATAGDTAAGCVSGAARWMKPRRWGWALGARDRGRFRIVTTAAHERSSEGRCPEQPPHSSAVTTSVPAGRLSSPSAGLKRIA